MELRRRSIPEWHGSKNDLIFASCAAAKHTRRAHDTNARAGLREWSDFRQENFTHRERRFMARLKAVFLALLFVAPSSSAEIFKCADKSGMDRYQNFPCAIDSIGTLSPNPTSSKAASPSGVATRARPTAIPVAASTTDQRAAATDKRRAVSEPSIGMTEDEVRATWGEPVEIIQDEPKDGRIEIWRYGDGRSVQFSSKHRVLIVDR